MPDLLVRRALAMAEQVGFANSCTTEVGRLLGVLTSCVRGGIVGEIGSGYGVGAAWIASYLAVDSRFVTVEADAARAQVTRDVLRAVPNARVIHGDWSEILAYGPLDVLFVDATPAKAPPAAGATSAPVDVIDAVRIGGIIVLDDFTPEVLWPAEWRGQPDPLRAYWLNNPRLLATEILTSPGTAAILATRRV